MVINLSTKIKNNKTMVKCWASGLGGCSNKQSREHFLSECLWDTDKVVVKGLWSNEAEEISINGLVAKVLCSTHNTNLSSIDAEMKHIKDTIQEFYRFYDVRRRIGTKRLCTISAEISLGLKV